MQALWLAALSIILSVLSFIALQYSQKHLANREYVQDLEARVKVLEEELKACNQERNQLQRENIELMRIVLGFNKTSPQIVTPSGNPL